MGGSVMSGKSLLTLVRGAPGSGKSTLAAAMVDHGIADVHLEADMFFTSHDGTYKYDRTRIGAAHKWCLEKTIEALTEGKRVVVSNTFTRVWELAPYLALGSPMIIRCEGAFQNVHGVPDEKVADMRGRMEPVENLPAPSQPKVPA